LKLDRNAIAPWRTTGDGAPNIAPNNATSTASLGAYVRGAPTRQACQQPLADASIRIKFTDRRLSSSTEMASTRVFSATKYLEPRLADRAGALFYTKNFAEIGVRTKAAPMIPIEVTYCGPKS
jgi:hypothetical protein